jgi:hypothetical protein
VVDPDQKDGQAALEQAQAAALTHFEPQRVSTYVNSSKNEGPRCVELIGQDEETTAP